MRLAVPFMVGDSYNGRRIVGTSPQMFGFTDDGKPAEGYDASGHLLPNYEDADTPESDRDPTKPVAAPVFKLRRESKYEFADGQAFANAIQGAQLVATEGLGHLERVRLSVQLEHGASELRETERGSA